MVLLQRKPMVTLFVNRSTQQWIVRDPEGQFWMVSGNENSWDEREPFLPSEATELEPIPGHYKYMLDLPF